MDPVVPASSGMSGLGTTAAIVRCGDLVSGVYATVRSLTTGSRAIVDGAVVADPTTPPSCDPWLAAFASSQGFRFVRVPRPEPGVAWNAGLATVQGVEFAICIQAGDTLARTAVESMAQRLEADRQLRFVTPAIEWFGPATRHAVTTPSGGTRFDILCDSVAFHISSMFRWADWEGGTRFDEDLTTFEHVDLWLRLLAGGGAAGIISAPLLRRRVHERALYKRPWLSPECRTAALALFERHIGVAESDPVRVMRVLERDLSRAHRRHADAERLAHQVARETEILSSRQEQLRTERPPDEAGVDFGILRRTSPLSYDWGYDRGTPADRPLIERFLAAHRNDIHGVVLEVQEDDYSRRFGSGLERVDVLDLDPRNPRATVVADLRSAGHLPSDTYDSIVLTQTLHVVDDMKSVISECRRLLKPGGVLLATLPCASRVCLEYGPNADFWRVTEAGARELFAASFMGEEVETTIFGNALVVSAFAYGIAAEELPAGAYDSHDPYQPAIISVRAVKTMKGGAAVRRPSDWRGAILMYHRVVPAALIDEDPHRLAISAQTFERQIEWLQATCTLVSLEQIADRRELADVPRAVALTFDDGCLDNLRIAAPVLQGALAPATFFLTTGGSATPYHYWWDRLTAALLGPHDTPPVLGIALPHCEIRIPTASREERAFAYRAVYREIVGMPANNRDAIVEAVVDWAGGPSPADLSRRITWDEAAELASHNQFTIGGHGVEHLLLPVQGDDDVRNEVSGGRAALQAKLKREVHSFAYPFGATDERVIAAVRDAGYRTAVSCVQKAVGRYDDPLSMPRIEITEEPLERFVAKLEDAFRGRPLN
jgi:peptidoglycan/xylan/chitin deacetylase (PgdA/CDA1 family)/SAM-dependent methyltransferase